MGVTKVNTERNWNTRTVSSQPEPSTTATIQSAITTIFMVKNMVTSAIFLTEPVITLRNLMGSSATLESVGCSTFMTGGISWRDGIDVSVCALLNIPATCAPPINPTKNGVALETK